MLYIFNSLSDVPAEARQWTKILDSLAKSPADLVGEEDLWEVVRWKDECPHLGNEYLELVFERIKRLAEEKYSNVEITWVTNSLSSYLLVNSEYVYDWETFFLLCEEAQEQITND